MEEQVLAATANAARALHELEKIHRTYLRHRCSGLLKNFVLLLEQKIRTRWGWRTWGTLSTSYSVRLGSWLGDRAGCRGRKEGRKKQNPKKSTPETPGTTGTGLGHPFCCCSSSGAVGKAGGGQPPPRDWARTSRELSEVNPSTWLRELSPNPPQAGL